MARRPAPLVAVSVAVLVLSGCTDDEPESAGGDLSELVAETGLGERPEVDVAGAEGVDDLVVEELVEGDGAPAEPGASVAVHYVGALASTGEEFDATWDRATPFVFTLGEGTVIAGWERGIAGMQEGARRRLTIPPDLAYGDRGVPGAIGPDETLVFVVDLVEVS